MTVSIVRSNFRLPFVLLIASISIVLTAGFVSHALATRMSSFHQQNSSNTNSSALFRTVFPMLNITAADINKSIYLLKNSNTSAALTELQKAHNQLLSLVGGSRENTTTNGTGNSTHINIRTSK